MIENIMFDMGGVLVDLDRYACVKAFCDLGFEEAGRLLDSFHQKGIFGQLEKGEASPEDLYEYVRRSTGRDIPSADIDGALCSFLTGLPVYKLQMLLDLRKRFNILLLSNTNPIMMEFSRRTFFAQQGLTAEDYFDDIFLSYQMGLLKPDERIFRRIIDEAGIDPSRTLFIDDGRDNTDAAARLGYRTYLASPQEDFRGIFAEL